MSAVSLRDFKCAWFGVWIFCSAVFLLWVGVANALSFAITAKTRKKENI